MSHQHHDRPGSAVAIFEAHAPEYTATRRRLVHCFDDLYGTAVLALRLAGSPMRAVLDLGAGTGLLAAMVRDAHPEAELTLFDGSPAMLAEARRTLGPEVAIVQGDLAAEIPSGPFDAIVSALAIHHLDDPDKRALFARVNASLRPGGVFVNAEQVRGPTPFLAELYLEHHRREAVRLGSHEEEWRGALERMRLDRWATVGEQLEWMAAAGLADVDCLWKDHRFAVLVGRHPPAA